MCAPEVHILRERQRDSKRDVERVEYKQVHLGKGVQTQAQHEVVRALRGAEVVGLWDGCRHSPGAQKEEAVVPWMSDSLPTPAISPPVQTMPRSELWFQEGPWKRKE